MGSLVLKLTYLKKNTEVQLSLLFIDILAYQGLIFYSAVGHIQNAIEHKFHFFFVENNVHFLILSDIIIFFANLFTNIIILFIASCIGSKKLKNQRPKL